MFDRLKFDKKNEEETKRQLDSLQKRLYEAIGSNGRIREKPIFTMPTDREIEEFEAIPIPREGRDAIEVEEELMKYVFTKQALGQHPRFFSFVASAVSPYSIAGAISERNVFGHILIGRVDLDHFGNNCRQGQ